MNIVSRKPSEAAPQRLSALARLPVFLDLGGKRAVLAGGAAGAAWKAELLAAAGADVQIFADEPCEELLQLMERGAAAGSLTLHRRQWLPADFEGAAIAVGDCESDDEALAFRAAAKAAGVPCNTIDRRETCDFEFGAIINRSPVVIGVSTNGAAPILAQNIRRRIETLLPPALSQWAGWARDIRRKVMDRLEKGAPRRAFWERFSDKALSGEAAPRTHRDRTPYRRRSLQRRAARPRHACRRRPRRRGAFDAEGRARIAISRCDPVRRSRFGRGAGTGAARGQADDGRQAGAKRLLLAERHQRPDAQARAAGKACRASQVRRPDDLRARWRRDRGVEGRRRSSRRRTGISTANALAASLGVSLTHRDCAQSVRFVTGHARTGELPADLDWRGLADGKTSLVFYMGGRTGPRIAARLLAEGLAATTPVLVAWSVSRADQGRRATTLAELATEDSAAQAGQPTIVCIGSAFAQAMRAEAPASLRKSA